MAFGWGGKKQDDAKSGLPDTATIKGIWRDIDAELITNRRNFALNESYHLGDQWVTWDLTSTAPQLIPYESVQDAESRMTVNGIRSRVHSLVGRLVGQDLEFQVQPQGLGAGSHKRQRLQEHLLEAERRDREWETIREEAVLLMLKGGHSAISVEWDFSQPSIVVSDPSSGTARRVGGPVLTALGCNEFGLEPGTRSQRNASYWMRATTLTPRQAQVRYKLEKPPRPDAANAGTAFQAHMTRRTTGAQQALNRVMVYVYYQPPTDEDAGGIVHVVGDHREEHEWPFDTRDLNLFVFRHTKITGTWIGDTMMNDARPVQRARNDARSVIRGHVLRASNARMVASKGQLDDDDILTNTIGEVLLYHGEPGVQAPHWMQQAEVSRWMQQEPANLDAELDEIMQTHAISKGEQIGDRNSGRALQILTENDNTPLGPLAREQARGWAYIAKLVLIALRSHIQELNNQYAIAVAEQSAPAGPMGAMPMGAMPMGGEGMAEEMAEGEVPPMMAQPNETPALLQAETMLTSPNKVPIIKKWSHEDIDETPIVYVPLEATTPRSQAAVTAEMIALGGAFPAMAAAMDLPTLARMTGQSSMHDAFTQEDSDVARANRENELMLEGVVCTPETWHEHPKDIRVHNDLRNTMDYETADPEVKQIIDEHIEAHEIMAMQDLAKQFPMPPGIEDPMLGGDAGAPVDEGAEPALEELPEELPPEQPPPEMEMQ